MVNNVFQEVPLVQVSFFQRIFKQLPVENSVIELNNLLASYPINQISKDLIYEIEERYQISLKDEFKLNLEEFYAVYLNHCLDDGILCDSDFDNLNNLKSILSLSEESIGKLNKDIGVIVYKKFFDKSISNGRLVKKEEILLEKIEKDLKLPKSLVNKICRDGKQNFMQNYLENIIHKLDFSPSLQQEVLETGERLNIDLNFNKEINKQLERLRIYWKLENLPLETIKCDIQIQKSEECYFKIDAVEWHELKNYKHKPINYNSDTKKIKRFFLNPQKNNNAVYTKYIDSGSLYLTNKRVIFIGSNKNLNIRFEKILRLTPQSDGIEIDKETIKSVYVKIFNQADEFSLILDKLIKQVK
ncbi:MAG: hypothetical protein J7574_19670 [Flavobacterium sp.]|uniref:hypothetical protein n=1 Tax=Flavobacterium sp. TaxID=239 RepID=UPI001B08358B|nr:hypothetical protein [Flavobacterium sp.]MBO9586389.1 hypothetical protein [Flavobacterium sp.]